MTHSHLRRNSSSRSSASTSAAGSHACGPSASAADSDLASVLPQRHRAQSQSQSQSQTHRAEDEAMLRSWEAEEERLTNALTRKLERLRADRAQLENELESESEAMVLRLQRQLQALQSQSQPPSEPQGHSAASSSSSAENAALRERLAIAEAAFTQQVHQCAAYRRELVQLRERLGLDVSDLEHASAQPTLSIYDSPDGVTQSTSNSLGALFPGGSSPPPPPTNSLASSSVQHPSHWAADRRAGHIAEEGQLRPRPSTSTTTTTTERAEQQLADVAE